MTLFSSLRAHLRLKIILLLLLSPLFCAPYLFLAHHAFLQPRTLPLTSIDRSISFTPTPWTAVYQSIYLLTTLISFLSVTKQQLWQYIRGVAAMSIFCFICFILYPVMGPIPAHWPAGGMYDNLRHLDGPYNAFPSLHAAFLAYALSFGSRILDRPLLRRLYVVLIPWGILILFATLATKQHYFIDLPAGVIVGLAADAWAARSCIASAKIAPISGPTSQLG